MAILKYQARGWLGEEGLAVTAAGLSIRLVRTPPAADAGVGTCITEISKSFVGPS